MGNAIVRVNGRTYETLAPLGDGGFASVLLVERDEKKYALKWTRGVTEADQLQRLLLEIQVQRLLQHANSLPIIDAEVRVCPASSNSRSWSPTRRRNLDSFPQQQRDDSAASYTPKEVLMVLPLYPRGTLQSRLEHAFLQNRESIGMKLDSLAFSLHARSIEQDERRLAKPSACGSLASYSASCTRCMRWVSRTEISSPATFCCLPATLWILC